MGNKRLGVGAVDAQDLEVETGEMVAEPIPARRRLAPEQTIVKSSRGFNRLPLQAAFGKLKAVAKARGVLGG
jgi:5-methyltetrahydropteroyltriglutamate--homocysteine methyltransferase